MVYAFNIKLLDLELKFLSDLIDKRPYILFNCCCITKYPHNLVADNNKHLLWKFILVRNQQIGYDTSAKALPCSCDQGSPRVSVSSQFHSIVSASKLSHTAIGGPLKTCF